MYNSRYSQHFTNYMFGMVEDVIIYPCKLKRRSKQGTISQITDEVKNGAFDISIYLNYGPYNDIIRKFYSIVETELPHCQDNAFSRKIKWLKIEELRSEFSKEFPKETGYYKYDTNKIALFEHNIRKYAKCRKLSLVQEETLFHELLHMASCNKKIGIGSGFHVIYRNKNYRRDRFDIGRGLNEGYTELLNSRYFSKKQKSTMYRFERILATGIEQIVGQHEMEKLYFSADQSGLIVSLSQWVMGEDAYSILSDIDIFYEIRSKNKAEGNIVVENLLEVCNKIARVQYKQNEKLFATGEISQEEYEFRSLRAAFFSKGDVFEKEEDGYIFGNNVLGYQKLSNEGYRIIKAHFFTTEESTGKYKNSGYKINFETDRYFTIALSPEFISKYALVVSSLETEDNIDLSNVEKVELLGFSKDDGYKLILKSDKKTFQSVNSKFLFQENASNELDQMLKETPTINPQENTLGK